MFRVPPLRTDTDDLVESVPTGAIIYFAKCKKHKMLVEAEGDVPGVVLLRVYRAEYKKTDVELFQLKQK